MPVPEQKVPLAAAIRELRREIADAIEADENERIRFLARDLELEFQVEILWSRGHTAKPARFFVLGSGAGGSTANTTTVKLTLAPFASAALTTQNGLAHEQDDGADLVAVRRAWRGHRRRAD